MTERGSRADRKSPATALTLVPALIALIVGLAIECTRCHRQPPRSKSERQQLRDRHQRQPQGRRCCTVDRLGERRRNRKPDLPRRWRRLIRSGHQGGHRRSRAWWTAASRRTRATCSTSASTSRRRRRRQVPEPVLAPGAGAVRARRTWTSSSTSPAPCRQRRHAGAHVGDLLIQYDLSQGGTNPMLFLSRWIDGPRQPQMRGIEHAALLGTKAHSARRATPPGRSTRRHPGGGVRRPRQHLAAHVRRGAARLRRPHRRCWAMRRLRERLPQEPLVGLVHLGAEGLHRPATTSPFITDPPT